MTDKIESYIETVPLLSRGLMGRALAGKSKSPRDAIKAKCLECSGFAREQAADCSVWKCPLYHLNPYRAKK